MLQLRSCKVTNFKSYCDETTLEFSPRVTYVLGPNNSGKTTLFEAIHTPSMAPHRSPTTIPREGDTPRIQHSTIRLSFSIKVEILKGFLLGTPRQFCVSGEQLTVQQPTYIQSVLSQPELLFDVVSNNIGTFVATRSWFAQEVTAPTGLPCRMYRSRPDLGDFEPLSVESRSVADGLDLGIILYHEFRTRVFRFRAERSRALTGSVNLGAELSSDAENLVQVLDNLQARHNKFQRYLDYVRRVLPELRGLGVFTTNTNQKGIRIWFFDGERDDFALPIEQAGSGVPNILALLYVITMSTQSRLIMIDEPSAFLHPGATRELIRVIREFPQHQYIISSHQPIAIDELDRVAMVLLQRNGDGSTIARSVDPARSEDQQAVLTTVGASLSDVFSADRVLWVEGMTETKVFRTVATRVGLPRGAAILPVVHTGDLEGANATLAIEIYRRLTESGALLPPAIAIVLDDEGRSTTVKAELRKRLRHTRVDFLPMRMIENIFLDPDLVHEFLRGEESAWGPASIDYSAAAISSHWDGLCDLKRYKLEFQRLNEPARWTREVHGAHILEDTFTFFTNNRLAYDKVAHGLRLTKLADEIRPILLEPIETLLRGLLK